MKNVGEKSHRSAFSILKKICACSDGSVLADQFWMSGIELQTQNHQNMHKFSLKLKMLNGVIFPLRFSDFLCILKTMARFVSFRLLLPILFLLTSYGPYTAPICLHLHISEKYFFFEHPYLYTCLAISVPALALLNQWPPSALVRLAKNPSCCSALDLLQQLLFSS